MMVNLFKNEIFDPQSPKMIRELMENIRIRNPKAFFQVVNEISKNVKSMTIAHQFKSKVDEDGNIVPSLSFAEYLKELYYKDDPTRAIRFVPATSEKVTVSMEEMQAAFTRLKSGKSVGRDGLSDLMLKNPVYRDLLISKLRPIFEDWVNGSAYP